MLLRVELDTLVLLLLTLMAWNFERTIPSAQLDTFLNSRNVTSNAADNRSRQARSVVCSKLFYCQNRRKFAFAILRSHRVMNQDWDHKTSPQSAFNNYRLFVTQVHQ